MGKVSHCEKEGNSRKKNVRALDQRQVPACRKTGVFVRKSGGSGAARDRNGEESSWLAPRKTRGR